MKQHKEERNPKEKRKRFESTKEAIKILNIKSSALQNCLCGLNKTCAGYRWLYKGDGYIG